MDDTEKLETELKNIEKKIPEAKQEMVPIRVFDEKWSPTIGELAGALSKAQGACSNGAKDKQGYGYKYMELSTLTDIIRPTLAENGLAVIQSHELIKGTMPTICTHLTLMHESGEWFKCSLELPIPINMPQLSPIQVAGIACTYGRRYSLQSIFLIASEEDSDAAIKK